MHCNICFLVLSHLRFPARGLIGIFWRTSRGKTSDVLATDGIHSSRTKPGWVLDKFHMKRKFSTPENWRDSPSWWARYNGLSLSIRWQEFDQSALICAEENTQFCNLELGSFSDLKKTDRGADIACGWRGRLQLEMETGNREQNCNLLTEMVSSCISGCLHNTSFKWSLWNRNKQPLQVAELRGCWISWKKFHVLLLGGPIARVALSSQMVLQNLRQVIDDWPSLCFVTLLCRCYQQNCCVLVTVFNSICASCK